MENESLKLLMNSPQLLLEIYRDLAKPGVQQAGKALGTVLGLGNTILWPIQLLNERAKLALESNMEKYRLKLENTTQDQICPVPPEIGVPIAEKLSYVTDETISDMYLELLARASVSNTAKFAHPSFVRIIEHLSPDEAVLLRSIRHPLDGIPFVEVRFQHKNKLQWNTLHPMLIHPRFYSGLQCPDNMLAYISNLAGLGIFDVADNVYLDLEEIYKELEEMGKNMFLQFTEIDGPRELSCNRGRIKITAFGDLFLNACFSNGKATN